MTVFYTFFYESGATPSQRTTQPQNLIQSPPPQIRLRWLRPPAFEQFVAGGVAAESDPPPQRDRRLRIRGLRPRARLDFVNSQLCRVLRFRSGAFLFEAIMAVEYFFS
jgi:hypothetical protein